MQPRATQPEFTPTMAASQSPRVVNLTLTDLTVDTADPEIAEAIDELFPKGKKIFPLTKQKLSFELKGVSPSVANAFRRVMCTEMPGPFLYFSQDDVGVGGSSEPFMNSKFCLMHISNIPLRYGLHANEYEGIVMNINYVNDSPEVKYVMSGDIIFEKNGKPHKPSSPFFNPTIPIGFVYPGNTLKINNIRVEETSGKLYAAAQTAVRGSSIPTDLEMLPREATHEGRQGDAQRSKYVLKKDGNVFTPSDFLVTVHIPAALEGSKAAKKLPINACDNMLVRMRTIRNIVDKATNFGELHHHDSESSFWSAQASLEDQSSSKGTLYLKGETKTITQILKTILSKITEVGYVGAAIKRESQAIEMAILYKGDPDDMTAQLISAIDEAIATITAIRAELKKA